MHYAPPVTKQPTSFRLSGKTLRMIREVSSWLGVSGAAVVEMAVRKLHNSLKKVFGGTQS